MILAFFAACVFEEPPSNDALAYVENRCTDIRESALQGECHVFNALSVGHPEAEKRCHYIEDPKWKAECFFLLADSVHHDLKETRRLCDRSDFLRNRCLSHWIRSQTQAKLTLSGDDLAQAASDIAAQIVGPEAAGPMSKRMLIEVMAKSLTVPFSIDSCRGLDSLCESVYLESVRLQDIQTDSRPLLEGHCERDLEERLAVLETTSDPRTVSLVTEAWEQVCSPSD